MTDPVAAWRPGVTARSRQRYVLISADTHAGASITGYRPYLAASLLEEFDAWADEFSDGWEDIGFDDSTDRQIGVASYVSPVNWEGERRLGILEGEGVAAEVLFPNTVPPFYPSGVISAPGPRDRGEYDRRWAGVQAHNRWLADFCSEVPGRRAGLAQVFFNDLDDTVDEIVWAKEHGLAGVLLPGDHLLQTNSLYYPRLDRLWALCADLDMPVHRHGIAVAEPASEESGDAAPAIGLLECYFFASRTLSHMILAGVFERFPALKFVITENNCEWVVPALAALDQFAEESQVAGTMAHSFAGDAVAKLERAPSDYFRSNCYLGSFFNAKDMASRDQVGLSNMMWGADFPHHEGTWPYTMEALRANFADVPEAEVRQLTSENAAAVYGFDLEFLQGVADRIGPTPSDLAVPLQPEEWPRDTTCSTFRMRDWK